MHLQRRTRCVLRRTVYVHGLSLSIRSHVRVDIDILMILTSVVVCIRALDSAFDSIAAHVVGMWRHTVTLHPVCMCMLTCALIVLHHIWVQAWCRRSSAGCNCRIIIIMIMIIIVDVLTRILTRAVCCSVGWGSVVVHA